MWLSPECLDDGFLSAFFFFFLNLQESNRFTKIHYLSATGGVCVCVCLLEMRHYRGMYNMIKRIPVFIYSTWMICYICNASIVLFFFPNWKCNECQTDMVMVLVL